MELNHMHVLFLLNGILCFAGGGVAICRLGRMSSIATKGEVRAIYVAYLIFYAISFLSPAFGNLPTVTQILMGLVIFGINLASFPQWRNGPPAHTFKTTRDWIHSQVGSLTGGHEAMKNADS